MGASPAAHQGPYFGEYVSVGSSEFKDLPGAQYLDVSVGPEVERDVARIEEALELARNLIAAAQWLETHT